jgi:hypothetical protein
MTTLQQQQAASDSSGDAPARPYALIAEFDNVDAVMAAARAARGAGYNRIDVHSPFPIHGIDKVIGIRPTILPWIVLLAGLSGLFGALVLTNFTMGFHYPYMISGKPFLSQPAFIPIIFECTILLAGITATVFMLLLNKLPMLYNPLLQSERFRRFSSDRLFLLIEASDRRFDKDQTRRFLEQQAPLAVELIEE